MNTRITLTAVAVATLAGVASADTVTTSYRHQYLREVNVAGAYKTGCINTDTDKWTRLDAPRAGVDSTLPRIFETYNVELPTSDPLQGTPYTFNVVSGQQHGFTNNQIDLLTKLWGTHQSGVKSQLTSAAFQIAVWEIVHDDGKNVNAGGFRVVPNDAAAGLAQSWLNQIAASNFVYKGPAIELKVLESEGTADQITFVAIPAPSAAAVLGLGALAAGRRRR